MPFFTLQVVENIHAVLVQSMKHIPKKWANIRGVFLKTADSVALPLFQALPERGEKIEAQGTAVVVSAPAAAALPQTNAKPGASASTSAGPKATKAVPLSVVPSRGPSSGVKKPALKGKPGSVKGKP